MQAGKLLHNVLLKSCNIHKKRLEVFVLAAETLVKCARLSVVGLGRGLINKLKTKYNITRMDRLIGNEHLYREALEIQTATAGLILGSKTKPCIIVDWSSVSVGERYQLLRAATPVGGRALSLYEEVHPLKAYNNPEVHKQFLMRLSQVLPPSCCPIIVTDAGFGIPWFKQVSALGWDFIGRVINRSSYTLDGMQWNCITTLLSYKKAVIDRIGKVLLTKDHKFSCYLQAYKNTRKGRIRKNVYGDKASRHVSVANAKSARQAWVLVHSLGGGKRTSVRVVELYAMRMQIEESFRDIKNPQFGFGLRYSRSLGVKRLTNLLLIGLIGTLLAWLLGLCAKSRNLHINFQTNSIKSRNVLSVFFIGCQIVKYPILFTKQELHKAIQQIQGFDNAKNVYYS